MFKDVTAGRERRARAGNVRSGQDVLAKALAQASVTRAAVVDSGALAQLPIIVADTVPGRAALVVADTATHAAAGAAAHARLAASGLRVVEPLVLDGVPRLKPLASTCDRIAAAIRAADAVPVAVGSGVINDLVKRAARLVGEPYLCVGTAASMDGYAASGAALIDGRFKRTLDCPPPVAVVADLTVMAAAPRGMAAWGYGDLAGKVVAGADWLLADMLGVETIARGPFDMVQDHLASWLADPDGIAAGRPDALRGLVEGLMISGFAMQAHGNSRPASGSDHLFAHVWEMEGLAIDGTPVSHGACVGIGCVTMLALYEWLRMQDVSAIDIDARLAAVPAPEALRAEVEAAFAEPQIAASALEETRRKGFGRAALRARLERLVETWPELSCQLGDRLPTPQTMRNQLRAVGAPAEAITIGVDRAKLVRDIRRVRLIRRRYTILDLLFELGWLDRAIEAVTGPTSNTTRVA
jgi:glycerol-1-phosphate dehydrogenase [NAD(P)+]